jgi:inhibitor of cysteine peptidase
VNGELNMSISTLSVFIFVGAVGLLFYLVWLVFKKLPFTSILNFKKILFPMSMSALLLTGLLIKPLSSLPPLTATQLRTVSDQQTLINLVAETQNRDGGIGGPFVGMPGVAEDQATASSQTSNTFVDTNVQVDGIKEGDIVKTDGSTIYYASPYQNFIKVLSVDTNNFVTLQEDILLQTDDELVYTESLYLTDQFLIVIGYRYDLQTNGCTNYDEEGAIYFCDYFNYWQPTGTVVFIDRLTHLVAFSLQTDGAFMDHRIIPNFDENDQLIDETLLLVGHRYLHQSNEELRPSFITNTSTDYLSYDSMFYFENDDIYAMTTFVTIRIPHPNETFDYYASALLGTLPDYKKMYVNSEHIYLAQSNYHWTNTQSYQTTTIVQYAFSETHIDFVASGIILGVAINQFALDEYNGLFRIATTETKWTYSLDQWIWNEENRTITNRLYILESQIDQNYRVVSLLEEGLGKPNESIMSVRFDKDIVYIVTFLRTDPLYIIDLSNPLQPIITSEIVLPGFDTYQHPWSNNGLVGIGYQADENGWTSGMKITAYDVGEDAREIQTLDIKNYVQTSLKENDYFWSYAYSEALWNHRAILVSVQDNIFAFAVNAFSYGYNDKEYDDYSYEYHSYYFIFSIDFDSEQPLSEPTIIHHPSSIYTYVNVDRGVMINDVIHTLSNRAVISYSLSEQAIIQTLNFYRD